VNNELFSQLLESIEEGGAILRGEVEPSRTFEYPDVDVRAIRERYNLPQEQFAAMLGVAVGTVRGWEQGRRRPDGAARVLLRVAEKHPKAVIDTVRGDARQAGKEAPARKGRGVSIPKRRGIAAPKKTPIRAEARA
jgi:putative transcriptional regulator